MCYTPQDYQKNGKLCPCGKCPKCKARRVSAWSFRLMQEEKRSTSAHFLTLTYDTRNVPLTEKGFMTISKRDLQLFFKRLRKNHGTSNIKYYSCGEYGGKTNRPHYHIILYNADINHVNRSWNKGEIHFGNVSGASIGYTLKYINKTKRFPAFKGDDRQREFSLMSKRLGDNYLDEKKKHGT